MAKVVITIADNLDGSLFVSAEFDPPVAGTDEGTMAQQVAAEVVNDILERSEHEDFEKGSN